MPPLRIRTLLEEAAAALAAHGIAEARLDAELLLGACLRKSRTELYLLPDERVAAEIVGRFRTLLARRKKREPLAYILGEREFWSLSFQVSPAVLIPRPETEFLLETVLARRNVSLTTSGGWLDVCCGSGVIAVVLARECQRQVIAADISAAALAVARENCRRHGVTELVSLVQADGVTGFRSAASFSLIVANPPYISEAELATLEPEVISYEPRLALSGGTDGLQVIRHLAEALPVLLATGGDCFIEIGADQGPAVHHLFTAGPAAQLYEGISIYQDYAGRDRVAHIRRL